MRRFRSAIGATLAALVLVVLAVAPVVRLRADGPTMAVDTINRGGFQGLSSEVNNVEFAFGGQYSVVAPFESSDSSLAPFEGDNHYLYITDLTGVMAPYPYDLSNQDAKLYYPSHLIIAPDSTNASRNFAYVRATKWNPSLPLKARGQEVVAQVGIVAGARKGQVKFDSNITQYFPITPVDDSVDPSAIPASFGLSAKGQFLVVTNGAQVTTIDVEKGDTYPVQLIPTDEFIPLPDLSDANAVATADYYTITHVEVDSNNLVTVLVNSRTNGKYSSKLFFYQLVEGTGSGLVPGSLTSQAIVGSDQVGAQIAPGSKAATSPDGKTGYFATTEGSLWGVKLSGSATTQLSHLDTYATAIGPPPPGMEAQPRNVQVDPTGKTITVVRQGAVLNIRRPAYGKHGGIRRPAYAKYTELPGMVIVRLDDKGSVAEAFPIQSQSISNGTDAISNSVFTQDGGAYFAASAGTSTGSLMQLSKADKDWSLSPSGALPPGVGRIAAPDAATIVGIQDFDLNLGDPSPTIIKGGSLVFMNFGPAAGVSIAASRAAIRRPCNVNH